MKKLNNGNLETVFRLHVNNILNYKKGMACFSTVKSRHDLIRKLNELCTNMSLELNTNILINDDVFFNYLEVISKVYTDSDLDQIAQNKIDEIDLLLNQKGA